MTVAVGVVVVDIRGRSHACTGIPAGDETLLDIADAGPAVVKRTSEASEPKWVGGLRVGARPIGTTEGGPEIRGNKERQVRR